MRLMAAKRKMPRTSNEKGQVSGKIDSLTRSIDDLARVTARGFEQAASKSDLKALESRVDDKFTRVHEDLKILRQDTQAGVSGYPAHAQTT